MPTAPQSRLAYIDWMRGLACVLMFQTHCYDSWLNSSVRNSKFFVWSQLLGSLPAPLFLFLSGISVTLVVSKLLKKSLPAEKIAKIVIKRGAEILALGLLFRLQEFLIAWGWAPWSDLLRVDVLNVIGVAIMLMGVICWLVLSINGNATSAKLSISALAATATISFLTPLLWTTHRPNWLPWPLESYINGVHNLGKPQAWLFPIFPWVGFAFAGLAIGFILQSDWARKHEASIFGIGAAVGIALIYLTQFIVARPWKIYGAFDYWHTSPEFFFLRAGVLLIILSAAYAWCRWGAGQWGFSPLVQLGQTSLLVYWVHIEFVYGRVSILPKRAVDIRTASLGLAVIFLSMLLLSVIRTRLKGRSLELLNSFRKPLRTT